MKNITEITILQIQEMLKHKEISVKELVQEYLRRIAQYDQGPNQLNSVLEINPDALSIAETLDTHRSKYTSPLYGLPILIKDNIDTFDGMHTSAGSLALADSFATSDADIVKTFKQKGAIILGKTNMTEFANHMAKDMMAGYSSRGGIVLSPYNKDKSPSGSSTGSAVAVSSNLCAVSIGTDTSGSIISPAITNGIVGVRPSTGTLSQKGIIPISFTLDTVGPMTRTVMDSIILFSELTNTNIEMSEASIKGTTIGIDQVSLENLNDEEQKKLRTLIKTLENSGAILKNIKLPIVSTNLLKKIQLYEFKYTINRYLSTLPNTFPIHSLKDIIEFNNDNSTKALKYGQDLLIKAEENTKGNLTEPIYKQSLEDRANTRRNMLQCLSGLDCCLSFQSNLILQYVGLPVMTIPHGLYNDGMPLGIYLTALDNIKLLKNAYKIEQVVGHRVAPHKFVTTC